MVDIKAEIQTIPTPSSLFAFSKDTKSLIEAFLAGRNPRTLRAYQADLSVFTKFLGASTFEQAASLLLQKEHGSANALILNYRNFLIEKKFAAATINRRLAAIRSLVKLARMIGLVPWTLEIDGVPHENYRDTQGPGTKGVRFMLDKLESTPDHKTVRNRAILRLLFDVALRRAEVAALDIKDVDLSTRKIRVLGKGRSAQETLTLPQKTTAALEAWVKVRGAEDGPLFINYDRAHKGNRLTGTSIYRIIRDLGKQAGLAVRPHGLRHAGITAALDATGGDVRRVQRFSRHRDVRTLTIYDDRRKDDAGEIACLISETI